MTIEKTDIKVDEMSLLRTLYQTKCLKSAALACGISLAGASRRLSHAREIFEDELFVRAGNEMVPTLRMKSLIAPIEKLLASAEALFSSEDFDLKKIEREVHIVSADNGVVTLLEDALARLYKDAPKTTIVIEPIRSDLFERLRDGSVDMALYPLGDVPKDFHSLELYHSHRAILVRKNHPLVQKYRETGQLTAEDINQYSAINISLSESPGSIALRAGIDPNLNQKVALTLPYFVTAPYILARTDFTFIAPVSTLSRFVQQPELELAVLPIPSHVSHFTPRLIWHMTTHSDPFLQWVRGAIVDCSRESAKKRHLTAEDALLPINV